MTDHPALPNELTIYTVGELHPSCLSWLRSSREPATLGGIPDEAFDVQADAVEEVDAAGVQLLLSLSHALSAAHRQLRLQHPSQRLVDACQELGADVLLANAVHLADTHSIPAGATA